MTDSSHQNTQDAAKIDQLLTGRWVLPMTPDQQLLDHHSIAVHQGRIIDILPEQEAKRRYQARERLNLPHHVVMPGLVNAHAHTPMNLFRGLADDLPLMDWLQQHIWPAEQATINAESVATGSALAMAEMIRGGTTCFNDHYFFPDAIANTAIQAGMRACVGLVIMSVPTGWADTEEAYFEKAQLTLQNGPKNPLIQYLLAPHAPYTVSDSSFAQIQHLSATNNLRIHMHVHETQFEIEQSLQDHGKRPLARLAAHNLLSDRFIHVHMTALTEAEIRQVAQTGGHVVHCPESNLKLASGFAPVHQLLDAGINVALGTDGAASNNDLDMWGELRTAALLGKAVSGDSAALPAYQALQMATINGAKALGLEQDIGSLEQGKYADMIAVDLSSYITQPIYNPISQLVYAANRLQVSDVWVAGRQLLRQGRLTTLDTKAIMRDAKRWVDAAAAFKSKGSTLVQSVG